ACGLCHDFIQWSGRIDGNVWVGNRVMYFACYLSTKRLKLRPVGLMVRWEVQLLTCVDTLAPYLLIRTVAFNNGKRRLCLFCYAARLFVGRAEGEGTITDHIQSLQQLAADNV